MPGQKSKAKAPVHVSIRRDRIEAARERLETEERTMTELVDHALEQYAEGRFTLPPRSPDGGS